MSRAAVFLLIALTGCREPRSPSESPAPAPIDGGALVADEGLVSATRWARYKVILPAGTDAEAVYQRAAAATAREQISFVGGIEPVMPEDLQLDGKGNRGLTDADLAGLRAAKEGVVMRLFSDHLDVLHVGAALVAEIAASAGGWIEDTTVRNVFTVASFAEARPPGFAPEVYELARIVYDEHPSGSDDLSTEGLETLGLPELILQDVPRAWRTEAVRLVFATAQRLVEHGHLDRAGELIVDLDDLKTDPWPPVAAAMREIHAGGAVTWSVTMAPDDAGTRRILLWLPGSGGAGERLDDALTTMFGPHPPAYWFPPDPALDLARGRARDELLALRSHFAGGIPEGERLAVKAPFEMDVGGIEWMWIEVQSWHGDTLTGLLLNEPNDVPGLHAGAEVDVLVPELGDYFHLRADGTETGGATEALEQQLRVGQ